MGWVDGCGEVFANGCRARSWAARRLATRTFRDWREVVRGLATVSMSRVAGPFGWRTVAPLPAPRKAKPRYSPGVSAGTAGFGPLGGRTPVWHPLRARPIIPRTLNAPRP